MYSFLPTPENRAIKKLTVRSAGQNINHILDSRMSHYSVHKSWLKSRPVRSAKQQIISHHLLYHELLIFLKNCHNSGMFLSDQTIIQWTKIKICCLWE
jgi:hypothetical protein